MARSSTSGGTKKTKAKAAKSAKAATPSKTKRARVESAAARAMAELDQDKSYVGRPVAKKFDSVIYSGTVKRFIPRHRLWAIRYEDGDGEEMDWVELEKAMELHDSRERKGKKKSRRGTPAKAKPATKEAKLSAASKEIKSPEANPPSASEDSSDGGPDDADEDVTMDAEAAESAQDQEETAKKRDVESVEASEPPACPTDKNAKFSGVETSIAVVEDNAVASSDRFVKPSVAHVKTSVAVVENKMVEQPARKFCKTDRPITVDAHLFSRNPCRVPGGVSRLAKDYPNYHKEKGSFGFLIQRLSDRNYAMRAMCFDDCGAEYNTYKKEGVNYISVVWYPPSNLDDHAEDKNTVDGCHLDLIDPFDGRTYLTGPNLNAAIVNAAEPVECLFLNGAQSNPGSLISADEIAVAISKCNVSLRCLSLTECKLNGALIDAVAACSQLRGFILENCQLHGQGADRPIDAKLAAVLRACPHLSWCFIKSSIFGSECWEALAAKDCCPNLEVLWVDAPLHTECRVDMARGDPATIRAALEGRAGMLKLCMINPDDANETRYVIGGSEGTDRLSGRERTEEEKQNAMLMKNDRGGSYLNTV